MRCAKIMYYGNQLEMWNYEAPSRMSSRRLKRIVESTAGVGNMEVCGDDTGRQINAENSRLRGNIKRAIMDFRRLVKANMDEHTYPVFVTLTYRENQKSIERVRADFNAYRRRCAKLFPSVRTIAIVERQERGAFHIHALQWGIPLEVATGERNTRTLAKTWRQGYVDLKITDNSPKIASYMCKYMEKAFLSSGFSYRKLYICSRNVRRPVVDKNPIVSMYYTPELSTPYLGDAVLDYSSEYDSVWVGRVIYSRFNLKEYAN